MTGRGEQLRRSSSVLKRLAFWLLLLCLVLFPGVAFADETAKLFATTENGFARIIIDFPSRLDLPAYKITADNGVLSVQFTGPVNFTLPDIAAALPDYVTVARIDPDRTAIRFGLRTTLTVNHMEAGEQLFIDLLPTDWKGLPPSLPPEVVANLAARAKQAEIKAEQERLAEEARIKKPVATVRVGRNPTFMRVEFIWNVDTDGKFSFDKNTGLLKFDWPVPIDVSRLNASLPPQLKSISNSYGPAGSVVAFQAADLVTPRFYKVSNRDFIVDIDTASSVPESPDPIADATAKALATATAEAKGVTVAPSGADAGALAWAASALAQIDAAPQSPITPTVAAIGSTIRITFPFNRDTSAAVFRRGDTVWMLFDTLTGINQPEFDKNLASIARKFTVIPNGDMQVVRLDLDRSKLATLGSEGKAWVLSIGDTLLAPTAPIVLDRATDAHGHNEVTANLGKAGKVHQFADPIVGDTLDVVTAYPPARGLSHPLGYVDFNALQSVQGLVVQPAHDDVTVALKGNNAVIGSADGLILSSPDTARLGALAVPDAQRQGFIDLSPLEEINPVKLDQRVEKMTLAAAQADNQKREAARLDLARLYLANQFGFEAIGVLETIQSELKQKSLKPEAEIALAAADVISARPDDALPILNSPTFVDSPDAWMWRSIAETANGDFDAARHDALAALPVIGGYPSWVKRKFLLAATRAALETNDAVSAERFLHEIRFADLSPDQVTSYRLLAGWIAEQDGRNDEALDAYGQVIAADVRPTRAEAIYRTIELLDKLGEIDPVKASHTLATEALLWRGDRLESQMDSLLASLYFRTRQYRLGFETVRDTVQYFPASPTMNSMSVEAQTQFRNLFLDGQADALQPIKALSLFYDFRALTPPGTDGDTMIRNLAQRLVKVDLLNQAAQLLQYQVDKRLTGAAQAQIATELAVIDLANRNPEAALKVLTNTQLADLPPSLERRRRLLEARALVDTSRNDLALDVLHGLSGQDADTLRLQAYWAKKDYTSTGSLVEQMYAPNATGDGGPPLTENGRSDILRAAVGYALNNDKIGLQRLRTKFAAPMAKGPDWPMFDFITSAIEPVSSPDFVKVARSVADLDTLNAFLAAYRQAYPGEADMTPSAATDSGTPVAANGASSSKAG